VYLVKQQFSNRFFAVKIFIKQKIQEEDQGYEAFYNEILLMKTCKQKNIIQLLEVWESNSSYYFVLPQCQGGSLLDCIQYTKKIEKNFSYKNEKTHQNQIITQKFIKQSMKQMLEALCHLKKQGIMHRDIKPDNILLQNQNDINICIIDFGLSTFQNIDKFLYQKCGTPGYVAPEIINMKEKDGKYTTQCDLFSLGCLLYFLLTKKPLFQGKNTKETVDLNKKCDVNFFQPEIRNQDPLGIIDPNKRITPEEALNHEYIQGFQDDDFQVPDDPLTKINLTCRDQIL
ncbi:protein kinase domain protein, partial [Ichthyophthirius multifiliis]